MEVSARGFSATGFSAMQQRFRSRMCLSALVVWPSRTPTRRDTSISVATDSG